MNRRLFPKHLRRLGICVSTFEHYLLALRRRTLRTLGSLRALGSLRFLGTLGSLRFLGGSFLRMVLFFAIFLEKMPKSEKICVILSLALLHYFFLHDVGAYRPFSTIHHFQHLSHLFSKVIHLILIEYCFRNKKNYI